MDGAVLGARLAAQGHHGGLPGEVDPELARKGVRHRRTLQLIEQGREGLPAGEAGRGKAAAAVDSGKVAPDRRQRLAPQAGRHEEEDRKSAVSGKSVSVRVDLGGGRNNKKKK